MKMHFAKTVAAAAAAGLLGSVACGGSNPEPAAPETTSADEATPDEGAREEAAAEPARPRSGGSRREAPAAAAIASNSAADRGLRAPARGRRHDQGCGRQTSRLTMIRVPPAAVW